jgi:hypothetical protein
MVVVSGSQCGAKHSMAGDDAAACVGKCVAGGATYVLATSDGKVYQLDNQDKFNQDCEHVDLVLRSHDVCLLSLVYLVFCCRVLPVLIKGDRERVAQARGKDDVWARCVNSSY